MDDVVSSNSRSRSVTVNPPRPMQGAGGESGDNWSSESEHGCRNLDIEEHTTTSNASTSQMHSEDASAREENTESRGDGEEEVVLKRKRQKPSNVREEFVEATKVAAYDANKMRGAIADWVLGTEQPLTVVEDDLFVKMMKTATLLFERVSTDTAKIDCFKVYEQEKKKLKSLTKPASKISLTTDCWKSYHQKVEYMVITAHFIDQNRRLRKHVLSVVRVPPPRTGVEIADGIYKCLKEWEIEDKIFTISVDNATYNDRAVIKLKENLSRVKKFACGGRLFRIRCCAHILNLLVKDSLAIIDYVIENVREGIEYINHSEARRQTFSNVAHQLQIHDRKLLLDVPTRWNSTFDMLSIALKFKDVFARYADYEPHFHHLPTEEDWANMESVCEILKVFEVCTNIISGSDYPTANLYLIELFRVKQTLDKGSLSENGFIRDMVSKMKEKFDKYWEECHLVMAIASVLDPRFKMRLVEFTFPTIFPDFDKKIEEVKTALYEMYSDYLEMHHELEASTHDSGSVENVVSGSNEVTLLGSGWEEFQEFIKNVDLEKPEKSELDMYLEEGVYWEQGEGGIESFNALEWWNVHKSKYQVLSIMAMDVLAIPLSTVASEATFSAGGRVIDPYRASLAPDTLEMLICGGDWIRQPHGVKNKLKKEEIRTVVLLPAVKTTN